jgi:hypothetical protein
MRELAKEQIPSKQEEYAACTLELLDQAREGEMIPPDFIMQSIEHSLCSGTWDSLIASLKALQDSRINEVIFEFLLLLLFYDPKGSWLALPGKVV